MSNVQARNPFRAMFPPMNKAPTRGPEEGEVTMIWSRDEVDFYACFLSLSGFKNMVRVIVNFICKQLVFLTFKPRDRKGFISVGEPLFLTPLVEAGKLEEAREASKVLFFASFRKVKMHIS